MNTITIPVAGVKRKIDDDDASNMTNTNDQIYERNGHQMWKKCPNNDMKTVPKKRGRPRTSYFDKVIKDILASIDPKDYTMTDVIPPPSPLTHSNSLTNPKNHMPSSAVPKIKTPLSPAPQLKEARRDNSSTASSVEELCRTSDLKDVNIDYRKAEFQINSCNFFQRYVYPILARENPHATREKVMDLAAAKWREFSSKSQRPNRSNETERCIPIIESIPLNVEEVVDRQDIKPTLLSTAKLQERGIEDVGREQIIELTSKIPTKNQKVAVSERDGNQTLREAFRVCPLIPKSAPPAPNSISTSSTNIYLEMPTTEEICSIFGLKNVKIDYTKAVADETFRDYVSFNKFVRPKLLKENPQAPMGKILMLVAAKWREFLNTNSSSGVIKKTDLTKEPKHEEIRDKQPSRNWKRLINKKVRRNINQKTNDEQKHASSADLTSQKGDGKNSEEYCSRQLNDCTSKLAISKKANCDAESEYTTTLKRLENRIETSLKGISNRSSSANGIKTQTTCPEVTQKLAQPILVEKNSQVSPEKLTFLDEVTGKMLIQNQTSEKLANYFVGTSEQENVSKPSVILPPPKSKSLVVNEEIEDRHSIIRNNHNTNHVIERSSSSASALGDQFQSSPSVKTEPTDETDCSNHNVDNDYENADNERENNTMRSPNAFPLSEFNYLRRLVVKLAAQGEPKEEQPEENPNEGLEEELKEELKEEPLCFSEDSTDDRSERESTVTTVDQNPRFLANAEIRTTIVNRMDDIATHPLSELKINNVLGQKAEDEYDVFGRWVAMKIRKMCSPLLKLQTESEISSFLLQKSAEDAGFSVVFTSESSTSGDETAIYRN